MDRRHKILLNVVVIVLIFAPLFFVLRHREWLSLYMNALSLFIILYMCCSLPITCWISSPAGAGLQPLAVLSWSRLSLVVMRPER